MFLTLVDRVHVLKWPYSNTVCGLVHRCKALI